jgi:hypothetical protein
LIPFICETFNANLFAGTCTKESIEMIFEEEKEHCENSKDPKNILSA